jgi:hypothetical protein
MDLSVLLLILWLGVMIVVAAFSLPRRLEQGLLILAFFLVLASRIYEWGRANAPE